MSGVNDVFARDVNQLASSGQSTSPPAGSLNQALSPSARTESAISHNQAALDAAIQEFEEAIEQNGAAPCEAHAAQATVSRLRK